MGRSTIVTSVGKLEYEIIFGRAFDKADFEIEALRTEISLERGPWIFRQHVHTKEKLLGSPRFSRIYSITHKIGDDVMNWVRRGALPDVGKQEYRRRRDRTARGLRSINKAIRDRKPLFWDRWRSVFESVGTAILENLPTLVKLVKALKGPPPMKLLQP